MHTTPRFGTRRAKPPGPPTVAPDTLRQSGRAGMGFRAAAAVVVLLAGCEDPAAPLVIGRKGTYTGEFEAPRGIAASGDRLAVVDRSGRLQEFTADGAFVRAF